MNRVKITLPETIIFTTTFKVTVQQINYGNHLGNDAVLTIAHQARIDWLTSLQLNEKDLGDQTGVIMADCMVSYKNEGFLNDQLTINLYIGDTSKVAFDLYYEIVNQDQKVIALVKTGMICFDYQTRKVNPIPNSFQEMW